MDISSLSVSVPTVIAVVGCFIGVMTFLGNRKRNAKQDTQETVARSNEQVRLLTSIDTRLLAIEENTKVQATHLERHDNEIHEIDKRVVALENKPSRKRGK